MPLLPNPTTNASVGPPPFKAREADRRCSPPLRSQIEPSDEEPPSDEGGGCGIATDGGRDTLA